MRPSSFCGGVQREFNVDLVVTATCGELLTCISVVVSVVGGVKGTINALSLEVPPSICNVYQRRRFVCVCGKIKGMNLKLLHLSLKVPPPIY